MLFYLIPVLITLSASIRYDLLSRRDVGVNYIYIFLFVYLTLLIGLRYEVGGDTLSYMGDYVWRDDLSEWSFKYDDNGFQPFYTLLCAIAKSISPDFLCFQMLHSILFNGLLFLFLYKYARYKFTALLCVFLICYLYFSTEILRESLAVLIFAFNYKNLKENKLLKYYIGVALSCLFHVSAVFLVVLPLLRWIKSGKNYFFALFCVLVIMIQLPMFFSLFNNMNIIAEKISRYDSSLFGGYLYSFMNILRYAIFPLFICFVAGVLYKKQICYEDMILILSLIGVCALFSFILFGRFRNYFVLFLAVLMSDVLCDMWRTRNRKLKSFSIMIFGMALLIYGSYYIHLNMYIRWVPYYSIYNPVTVNRDNF